MHGLILGMPQDEMVSLLDLLPGICRIKCLKLIIAFIFSQTNFGEEILDAKTDQYKITSRQHH
jgi:hypothetical protein